MTRAPLLLLACVVALGAAACGPGAAADDDAVTVVASTDVYGDIAEAVAGGRAEVTSIVTSSAQDPHSHEATAQDRLAVSRADLVVANGGGYDPFVDTLVEATGPPPTVVEAVDVSGLAPEALASNEHVWYDLDTAAAVAEAIAGELSAIDPAGAAEYRAGAEAFAAEVDGLRERATSLARDHAGTGSALTEPVPAFLLASAGLEDRTPEAFSEAVEEGTDVAPTVLRDTLDVVADEDLGLLALNPQTSGPESEEVRRAAEAAGVPVVEFTETLPGGQDYLGWMRGNLDAIAQALA